MVAKMVEFGLEKAASAKGRPTAHIALAGKPDLSQIIGAQRLLLELLPKFHGFGLKACQGCHSGLDGIVIHFGRPLDTRLDNIISKPIRALPQDPTPI